MNWSLGLCARPVLVSHHFLWVGPKVSTLKNMAFPTPATKNMQKTLPGWYLTVAMHHGEGAGPSLNYIGVDNWV